MSEQTQLPKRPHTLDVERAENWLATNHPYFSSSRQLAEVLHDYSLATCQDAKIAELEKELKVMNIAIRNITAIYASRYILDKWGGIEGFVNVHLESAREQVIEAARKESNDGEI